MTNIENLPSETCTVSLSIFHASAWKQTVFICKINEDDQHRHALLLVCIQRVRWHRRAVHALLSLSWTREPVWAQSSISADMKMSTVDKQRRIVQLHGSQTLLSKHTWAAQKGIRSGGAVGLPVAPGPTCTEHVIYLYINSHMLLKTIRHGTSGVTAFRMQRPQAAISLLRHKLHMYNALSCFLTT